MLKLYIVFCYLVLPLINVPLVDSNGCMPKICSSNVGNEIDKCFNKDEPCGQYKGRRSSGSILEAVDLECLIEDDVFAPISGELSYYKPYGGEEQYKCLDHGMRIEGTGQWTGYYVNVWPVTLDKYGGKVTAGEKLGKAGSLDCNLETIQRSSKNHVRIELFKEGKPVDPTYHMQDCMCTGWICETNPNNNIIGEAFKSDSRYNGVRGWELECPNAIEDDYGSDEVEFRSPDIYSPIEGSIIGRTRLNFDQGIYEGCDNEGIFITGAGQWLDFEARLYNVRYYEHLKFGSKYIQKGMPIGRRLNCPNSPDSIFLELRFQGKLINITDIVTADSCKMPNLPIF
uniref:Peptidase_M23 domain-containing protein n=1 Tax=Strongyloides venezuelensis TaxID=75913 RepID=A0A0K0EXD7_STRVS